MITVPEAPNSASRPSEARRAEAQRRRLSARVLHLRGDGALPDQLVERVLVARQLPLHVGGRPERVAGGPDRLVRLLRVLHLALVAPRRRRDVLGAVELRRLRAGCRQRRLRQRRRVGAHVGDVAVLVETLGEPHRRLRREAELAARLLLQRRGHERRRRAAAIRLLLDPADGERGALERARRARAPPASSSATTSPLSRPSSPKSRPWATRWPSTATSFASNAPGSKRRDDVPVGGGDERHPLALALDDEPRGDGLDAACREALRDLLPEHRRDLVAVEAVEDAPRLLGVDEAIVDVARCRRGRAGSRRA